MAISAALVTDDDIRAFIDDYFEAWSGTDEDRILAYYSDDVSLEIPGTLINGKAALRDQFVRPFIAGFPGNRHMVKKMIFGGRPCRRMELRSSSQWAFRRSPCNRYRREAARLRGVRIRSSESKGHIRPYLFRRHDTTQTDFIVPASSAAGPAHIVVRFTGLSKVRESSHMPRGMICSRVTGQNQYQRTMDAPARVAHCYVMVAQKQGTVMGRPLVSVVDDDESVRESLPDLVREFGFCARAFSSAEEFLTSDYVTQTRCLILDVYMPGMTGPDLLRELKLRQHSIPIVFMTAKKNGTVRPQLLEQGAVECLFKPFSDTALLDAINVALRIK